MTVEDNQYSFLISICLWFLLRFTAVWWNTKKCFLNMILFLLHQCDLIIWNSLAISNQSNLAMSLCVKNPNHLFPSRVSPWEMESLELNIARKCCFCSKAVMWLEFSGVNLPWTCCGTGCTLWIQLVLILIVLQWPRWPWLITQAALQARQWHWWNALWVYCSVTCIAWGPSLLVGGGCCH